MFGSKKKSPNHATGRSREKKDYPEIVYLGAKESINSLKHQAVLGLQALIQCLDHIGRVII
jgi:hypothetical protein